MKKLYFFAVFLFLSLVNRNSSFAQIVGVNCYLQGAYVEIGMCTNSAFGAAAPPAGYHPHLPGAGPIAEVYDYGHDGWAVGAPPYMGDYTYPGSPFEGWAIQMNGMRAQQYASPAYTGTPYNCTGGSTMTATSWLWYSNTGGSIKGMWTGTYNAGGASLLIRQETRVDTLASAVVVTTSFRNISAVAANNVYYWRSSDPDNDQTWPGGGFPTDNYVDMQTTTPGNPTHKVSATGIGRSPTRPPLTLCTKDQRAVGLIYGAWGLGVGVDLATVWNMTYAAGPGGYAVGPNYAGDIAHGLVFNLCNIAPGDSTAISYAYVFNGFAGMDDPGALPDPIMTIGGVPASTISTPTSHDTVDGCLLPGVDSVAIDIPFGADRSWITGTWTWAPGTGLSATTGTHVFVRLTALPGIMTYTVIGTTDTSCGPGLLDTFYFSVKTCHDAWVNSPCLGDVLHLGMVGDSLGATYVWSGPGGFTSTLHNPWRYPTTWADTGLYRVIRTIAGIHDTDSVRAVIHPLPIVSISHNAPLCEGMFDTLRLDVGPVTPGMTYIWSGPAGFSSTLKDPIRPGFDLPHVGIYTVSVTTVYGCGGTATAFAGLIPRPAKPILSNTDYCQGMVFNPFTVTGLDSGAVVWWWPGATSGPGTTTSPTLSTSTPGSFIVWASQRVGSCESQRAADTVRIIPTPPAPLVTGPLAYCQYIGPVVPLVVTPSDSVRWYNASVGGTFSIIQPMPDINVPGTLMSWVSRIEDGCEGPRTPVTRNIHPKPAPPIVHPQSWCQFKTANPIDVTPSGAGDVLTYYGPGVTSGMLIAPTPSTSVAPDTIVYYITETTAFGCISDSAMDKVVIRLKPAPPIVTDLQYCQGDIARPLNEVVDSDFNSTLNWYYNSISLPPIPVPFTDTTPGTRMWFVGQNVPAVNGCASDSIPIKVTIIYKPKFSIEATSPWVCQFDTVTLAYKGPALYQPEYLWTFPRGAAAVNFTDRNDSIVQVKFDSTHQDNYVYLRASNHNGFCYSDTSIRIKVIPLPTMEAYTKPDVCFGDTVQLALATKADNSYSYKWWVDDTTMEHARALSIISRNSHSSGPYTISWLDSGRHIIKVSSTTEEGCKSEPTFDSVLVHNPPDARFRISSNNEGKICWEDSVQFSALTEDYRNSYEWAPAHDFDNLNSPIIWGKMLGRQNTIILKVTDPFGCYATESLQVDPEYCCTIQFPNAFTPNGTGPQDNNIFKPYFVGYHRFHMFRIMNRWGQIIFESANSSVMGWDGTFNGVPQDVGVYYYYLRYDCGGKSMEAKGDVTLIR